MPKLFDNFTKIFASHAHIIALAGLFVYLVILPASGVKVSTFNELIGGNYTNVVSAIAACIAAGGTVQLAKSHKSLHERIHDLEKKLNAHSGNGPQEGSTGSSPRQ